MAEEKLTVIDCKLEYEISYIRRNKNGVPRKETYIPQCSSWKAAKEHYEILCKENYITDITFKIFEVIKTADRPYFLRGEIYTGSLDYIDGTELSRLISCQRALEDEENTENFKFLTLKDNVTDQILKLQDKLKQTEQEHNGLIKKIRIKSVDIQEKIYNCQLILERLKNHGVLLE